MIRKPAVAGQFYPGTATLLKKQLAEFIDQKVTREDVIGLVCPHAGYIYSGQVAGETFSKVNLTDTVIILGPNHSGSGGAFSIVTEGIWQTPLGNVKINSNLAKSILNKSKNLSEDLTAHIYEHSLEVQLPFLQYIKSDVEIVPIVLSPGEMTIYKEIGQAIASALREIKKKVIIIASSNMTHYEPQKDALTKDKQAIEAITELDEEKLLACIDRLNISMCGYVPVSVLICASKELGAKEGTLIKYQTSGEATADYSSVVGYAGILIK